MTEIEINEKTIEEFNNLKNEKECLRNKLTCIRHDLEKISKRIDINQLEIENSGSIPILVEIFNDTHAAFFFI